jgi:hypothetical protein
MTCSSRLPNSTEALLPCVASLPISTRAPMAEARRGRTCSIFCFTISFISFSFPS